MNNNNNSNKNNSYSNSKSNSKRLQLSYNRIKEHPDGYHGHYNREYKQLVTLDDLNNLNINEGNIQKDVFLKYYSATKKLEHTLISNKDFVSVNDDEGNFRFLSLFLLLFLFLYNLI